jgi:hypothetical protein
MFASSRAGCCNPAGHCGKSNRPPAKDCHIQPFDLTRNLSDTTAQSVLPAFGGPVTIATMSPASAPGAGLLPLFLPQASPPDLSLLHSVFRI